MKSKILIVDDEVEILEMFKEYFEIKQHDVLTAINSEEALKLLEKKPNIIFLDINMPKVNGIELCIKIRDFIQVPIIFLTARIEESDKINGFKAGADDYIVKPFSLPELEARIEAHIRRDTRNIKKGVTAKFFEDVTVDYSKRKVFAYNQELFLTKKEFEIIELLTLNKNQVFNKDRIYNKLWISNSNGDSSLVVEHIRRIREKFKKANLKKEYICTIWGVGYTWEN